MHASVIPPAALLVFLVFPPLEDVKHDVESPGLLPHAAWPKVPGKVGTVKPVELLLKVAATKVATISKSISSTPPPSRKRRSTLIRGIESHPPRCISRRGGGHTPTGKEEQGPLQGSLDPDRHEENLEDPDLKMPNPVRPSSTLVPVQSG